MSPDKFKKLREKAKLSQGQLAKKMGVTRAAISLWEKGTNKIPEWAAILVKCKTRVG